MERLCKHCGKPIPDTRSIKAVFCCTECGDLFERAKSKAERMKARELKYVPQYCLHCGELIPRKPHYDRKALFCCDSHRSLYRKKQAIKEKPRPKCVICGVPFARGYHRQKRYCSKECYNKARRLMWAKKPFPKFKDGFLTGRYERCEVCDNVFYTQLRSRTTCGEECERIKK